MYATGVGILKKKKIKLFDHKACPRKSLEWKKQANAKERERMRAHFMPSKRTKKNLHAKAGQNLFIY